MIPVNDIDVVKSSPITNIDPIKPNERPTHCLILTFSFNKGPAKIPVKIGCKQIIIAIIPTLISCEYANQTPPR